MNSWCPNLELRCGTASKDGLWELWPGGHRGITGDHTFRLSTLIGDRSLFEFIIACLPASQSGWVVLHFQARSTDSHGHCTRDHLRRRARSGKGYNNQAWVNIIACLNVRILHLFTSRELRTLLRLSVR